MKALVITSILTAALQFAPLAAGENSPGREERLRGHRQERFANLSEAEREKLKAAHREARQDPQVQAARQKMRQARKQFRDAMHASMLKADPSIQPILDKMPKTPKGEG